MSEIEMMGPDELQVLESQLAGFTRKYPQRFHRTIVYMGPTGGGKTTLFNLILKKSLTVVENSEGGLEIINAGPINEAKISSRCSSETTSPNIYFFENEYHADVSGFNDTRSTLQEIANAYFIKKVISNSDLCKIVLVVKHGTDLNDRGNIMSAILVNLVDLIPDTEKLISCLSIVVTCCPRRYTPKHFANSLRQLAEESHKVASIKGFLERISKCEEKISLFKKPFDDITIDLTDSGRIWKSIEQARFVQVTCRLKIGERGSLDILKLEEIYQKQIYDELETISRLLRNRMGDTLMSYQKLRKILESLQSRESSGINLENLQKLKKFNELSGCLKNIEIIVSTIKVLEDFATGFYSNSALNLWHQAFQGLKSDLRVKIQEKNNEILQKQQKKEKEKAEKLRIEQENLKAEEKRKEEERQKETLRIKEENMENAAKFERLAKEEAERKIKIDEAEKKLKAANELVSRQQADQQREIARLNSLIHDQNPWSSCVNQ